MNAPYAPRRRWREGGLLFALSGFLASWPVPVAESAAVLHQPDAEVARSAPAKPPGPAPLTAVPAPERTPEPESLVEPVAEPPYAPEIGPIATRLEAPSPAARTATLEMLAGYGPLLRFLPLDELEHAHTQGDGVLELSFDFDRRSARRVVLPSVERWVIVPTNLDEPLLDGEPKQVKSDERTLIVHRRLRLRVANGELAGVVDGDLEVAWGPFSPNVSLATEHRPGGAARDSKGRIVLQPGEDGFPRRGPDGRWVAVRADRWLVLEVRGRRFELPLR